MIFRRVLKHVQDQNWTAVAIDLVIVVVGVFLGIQLGNWNAERQERELGAVYVQRIASDLRADAEVLEASIQRWQREERDLVALLAFVEEGDLGAYTRWGLAQLAYYRSGWGAFLSDRTAYEELRSTGQIRLISDTNLRRSIINYYAGITESELFYTYVSPLREMIRSKYAPALQRYFWATCVSGTLYNPNEGRTDCPPFEETSETTEALEALRADPNLAEAIRYGISVRLVVVGTARRALARNQALIALIENPTR